MSAGVLAGVLRAQRLDVHDIEGIHILLHALLDPQSESLLTCTVIHPSVEAAPDSSISSVIPLTVSPKPSPIGCATAQPLLSPAPTPSVSRVASLLDQHSTPHEAQAQDCSKFVKRDRVDGLPGSRADAGAEHSTAVEKLRAMPEAEALDALLDYLIAATAKDCAVMVTMQAACDGPGPGTQSCRGANCSVDHACSAAESDTEGGIGGPDGEGCQASGVLRGCKADGVPCIRYKASLPHQPFEELASVPCVCPEMSVMKSIWNGLSALHRITLIIN